MHIYKILKNILLPAVFVLSISAQHAWAGKFVSRNNQFAVNASDGFNAKKHTDPNVVIYALRGNSSFMVSILEDTTQDRYLGPKLADERQEIFQRNLKPSRLKTLFTMAKTPIYYFEYRAHPNSMATGYFNYGGRTYLVQTINIKPAEFGEIFSTLRSPKAALTRPQEAAPPPPPSDGRIRADLRPALEFIYEEEYKTLVADHKAAGNVVTREALPTEAELLAQAAEQREREAAEAKARLRVADTIKHEPLSFYLIWGIIGAWFLLSIIVSAVARKLPYPSIAGFSNDLPPDFFFPFTITSQTANNGIFSRIVSRTDQVLESSYSIRMMPLIPAGLAIIIVYESLFAASVLLGFQGDLVMFIDGLPYSNILVFAPYALGALLVAGGVAYSTVGSKKELIITANEQIVLRSSTKSGVTTFIDENNRVMAKLHKLSSMFSAGFWECQNSDGEVMYHIVDMRPGFFWLRRLLGDPLGFGAIRARYAIVLDGKGVGFILNDSMRGRRFQIHLDPEYGRIIYPVTAIGAMLLAKHREPDRRYPWPF